MKDVTFTVEFLRHVLANGTDGEGTRDRFQHSSDGSLVFLQSWWHSAFTAALPGTGIRGVKPNHICMDPCVTAPTEMYRRRYGKGQYRTHEAIMPGTKVIFRALVDDYITESILRTLLDRVGSFIGLSPYGHRLGYGKFKLLDLIVQPSAAYSVKQYEGDENGHSVQDNIDKG